MGVVNYRGRISMAFGLGILPRKLERARSARSFVGRRKKESIIVDPEASSAGLRHSARPSGQKYYSGSYSQFSSRLQRMMMESPTCLLWSPWGLVVSCLQSISDGRAQIIRIRFGSDEWGKRRRSERIGHAGVTGFMPSPTRYL